MGEYAVGDGHRTQLGVPIEPGQDMLLGHRGQEQTVGRWMMGGVKEDAVVMREDGV